MAFVTKESIEALKKFKEDAQNEYYAANGLQKALEGLSAAIAQLEQLQVITQNFEVVIIPSSKQDRV